MNICGHHFRFHKLFLTCVSVMAMAPAIIVYLFTQRWVMEGVTQGAVKG